MYDLVHWKQFWPLWRCRRRQPDSGFVGFFLSSLETAIQYFFFIIMMLLKVHQKVFSQSRYKCSVSSFFRVDLQSLLWQMPLSEFLVMLWPDFKRQVDSFLFKIPLNVFQTDHFFSLLPASTSWLDSVFHHHRLSYLLLGRCGDFPRPPSFWWPTFPTSPRWAKWRHVVQLKDVEKFAQRRGAWDGKLALAWGDEQVSCFCPSFFLWPQFWLFHLD